MTVGILLGESPTPEPRRPPIRSPEPPTGLRPLEAAGGIPPPLALLAAPSTSGSTPPPATPAAAAQAPQRVPPLLPRSARPPRRAPPGAWQEDLPREGGPPPECVLEPCIPRDAHEMAPVCHG